MSVRYRTRPDGSPYARNAMIEDPRMNLAINLDHPHAKAVLAPGYSMETRQDFATGQLPVEMTVELDGVKQRYRLIQAPELHYDTRTSPGFARTEWAPVGKPEGPSR